MRKTFLFILALCATTLAWGEDKSITETYVNAVTGASKTRVSFKSSFDENFTVWQRGGRSKTTDVVSIGGQDVKGFWLSRQASSNNSCYIEWGETDKQYLGGVKSVSFAYKQFGDEANHTMILDIEVNGDQVDQISFPAGTSPYPTYSYSKDLNAKKLTKLTIRNSSTATEGTTLNGRFVVGPVTITPYLYCPSSAQNVQYKVSESATYINPDFIDNTEGEATWSCSPEGIVTVADGVVTPIEGKSGKVVITAKLNDIEVSYNLEVIAKGIPEVNFDEETVEIDNLYTTAPVTNALTVTKGAGAVTYTSSNTLVAVIKDSKVEVVGVGTATITATTAENDDFVSGSASYTLTVNEPEGEAAVSEDFDGKLPLATSYQTEPVNFTDQDGLYAWTVNGHKYDGTWVRFATNANACMTSQGIQEGGVKRLSFTWKRANGECTKIHTTIKALDGDGNEIVDRSIELTGSEDQTSNQTYNMRFDEVKQNAQFYLRNEGDGFVILISDIKIIPYLLYTQKSDELVISASETEATYKNEDLINNTGETPTFSIVSSNPASIATIDNDGTVTATASGTITVQAKWENVTTTYTLNITKYTLPVPQVSFEDGNAVTKDMNVKNYVNTLTKDGDGVVTYESSDETVATVNNEGVITIIGEGITTITATINACTTHLGTTASYELTVTDPQEEAYIETFDKLPDETKASVNDRTGDWYTWKITTGARHKTSDKLFNGTRSLWLSGNGDASMETSTPIEGGIKRVSFLWNKFAAPTTVSIKVTAGEVTRSLTKEVSSENQNDPDLVFNSNFGVKSNAKLKIANPQNTTALQIGPIKITPYLLYTKKVVEVTYDLEGENTVDATANLINNTGETPTITLSGTNVQAQLDEDGKTINLANATEDVTVTASWNEGKVTTTFTLKVTKEPVYPEVTFQLGDAVNKTMNDVPFVNAIISPTEGLGEIAYSSTDPTVAEVATDGTVTIIGAGETEIKLAIDASDTYDATEVKYTLTVTEPESEEAYIETFKAYETAGWPSSLAEETDRTGDDATITWKAKSSRHATSDNLKNGDRSTWFAQNGYIKTNFEGGIKRIAFQWNKFTASTADITLAVSAGDKVVNATYSFEATTNPINQVDPDINFNRNFFVQKNVELQIKNVSATDKRAQVGPIKITPYLFYKTKYVEVMKSAGPYVNTDIINNTNGEGTITFESSDPETAYIFTGDELHPDKVVFVKTGTVTITATWEPYEGAKDAGEYVTTSYTLKINDREYSDAHFEVSKVEKKLGDKFTYTVTRTKGEGDVEYSSDDPTIAEVNASTGEVTVHRIGTTKINAHVDESAQYYAWDGSYTLIVRTGIADDNKLVEKFTKFPTSIIDTKGGKDVNGDIGVTWHAYQTRRGENDTIGGTGVQGNNINAKGYIKSNTALEGGIKYFSFNWKQWATESNCTLKLRAKLGESEFSMEKAGTGAPTYEHYFFAINAGVKTNANIELYNESYNGSGSLGSDAGRITFDAFEIVPYLFYKTKSHKIDVVGGDEPTWTNEDLINNTDGGTIVYSVPEGNGVATIDPESGEVTAVGNGITTVTATWTPADALEGEVVTTTYEVEVFYSKLDAELDFNPKSITVGVDAIAFSTPTLSNPHELIIEYSSSDETIATVNENGEVTLKHAAGDVVISAKSAETGTYKEGNASYTIHVLPLPDVTFPNLTGTDNIKTVDMDKVPFTETILIKVNEEDVTSSATITYESSNEEVAIIKNNKVNIIGVGTAYITAKIAQTEIYAGRDVYYTLTVEDDTPAEKQWTETFPGLSQGSYYDANPYKFTGKDGVYSWAMRTFRCKTDGNDDKVGGDQGIRIKDGTKSNYIEFDGKQEGGVKRVKFYWRQPGDVMAADLNIKIDNTVQDNLTLHRDAASKDVNSYNRNVFVKSNTKMTITVPTDGNAIIIGPITITPYLLYTTKTATLNLTESSTYKNEDLINNLELDDEVTYSIIKGNEGSIATIDPYGTVTATAAGEITIQAKWTDGDNTITTTYKLKIEKHITISESADNSAILAANDGKTVDVKIVRSALVANTWNSLCLPFDIEKSELGDAKVAILDRATLEDDVLNIWLATVTGETLTAGTPYLVLPSENIDLSKTYESKLIVAEEGNQEVYMVTLQGIFSRFAMTQEDKNTLFLGQPDEEDHNLFYASENGYLKGMRAYFSINNPSGAPVRVGRIGIQQTPTELGGEADRLNGRQAMKVLRDGQFYIIRETKTYNAQGIEIQ